MLSPVVAVENKEAEGAARTEAIAESNLVVMVALRGMAGVPWAVLVVLERAGALTYSPTAITSPSTRHSLSRLFLT